MAISVETVGRLWASGRNYVSTAVGFIGGIGLMSAAESKGLMAALNQIYEGVALIVTGATSVWQILIVAFPIIGVAMAKLASNSAKTDSQAQAVQAAVKDTNTPVSMEAKAAILDAAAESAPLAEKIKITDEALAAAVPSNLVVAKT